MVFFSLKKKEIVFLSEGKEVKTDSKEGEMIVIPGNGRAAK